MNNAKFGNIKYQRPQQLINNKLLKVSSVRCYLGHRL